MLLELVSSRLAGLHGRVAALPLAADGGRSGITGGARAALDTASRG
ncbi:hypothetical protein [Streptomyces sp. NPDC004533]